VMSRSEKGQAFKMGHMDLGGAESSMERLSSSQVWEVSEETWCW
jgi:hypothetical protein